MKTLRFTLPLVALIAAPVLPAQSFHAIARNQNFRQTSASTVAPDPVAPFVFTAQSAVNATLTLPGGGTASFVYQPGDNRYQYRQSFATKTALDAAFPDGNYRMTGPGIPTLSFTLASNNYPTVTPQVTSVTNGTWNSGGMLVVNPAQNLVLNFSTFTGYATSGVAGHINFYLTGMTESSGNGVQLETDRFSQPFFGAAAEPTALTTYTVPAGTFVSGRVYQAWLDYDTVIAMDMNTIPGSAVGTLLSKETTFYIAAQNPGTSTPPPVLEAPLTSRSAVIGGTTTFSVGISVGGVRVNHQNNPGNVPLGFTWTLNGRYLGDASTSAGKYINSTGDSLTINALTAADAGTYGVTIVTAGGVVSSTATLAFSAASVPAITTQPRGATVNAGSTVALTVTATGSPTPAYQWRKDGAVLTGATSDTLVLAAIAPSAAGTYTVVVSNSAGAATSNAAALVVTSGQPSRLPNLSVRTNLGASQTLIVGFATNGAKTMLVRGIGPTLAAFGLSGVLPDPTIELYNSAAAKVDENNDWSPALSGVFSDVGAFALTGGSKDAALQRACIGAYTAQIKSSGAGVVLVEVYDTGGSGKLMNVSARNAVGTGDDILIAGFVVDGSAAKTLLIRGVGAKLAEFGVSGVLADPKLEIYNAAGLKIAENDNWNALLQPTARGVGAFDLTLGSRDSALLITLAPGTYTAQISGVGGGTGEAIVEVYEVP